MGILLSVLVLAFAVFALVTLAQTDDGDVKLLPKFGWALVIIFVPLLGSLAFFAVGKTWSGMPGSSRESADEGTVPDRWDHEERRRREREQQRRLEPDDGLDDEARIEAEIRFHEQQAEIRRLEAKLRAEREARGES